MKISRSQLKNLISDAIDLDLQKGDVILTGRFKNKRTVVKDIGKDDLGQPTVNGMKALAFRVEKLMPKDKWSAKSKEEAEEVNEMKITKRQLKQIIREELLNERGTGNPDFGPEERALMDAAINFHEKYMLAMGMDPSNPADTQRTRRVINDIIGTVLGT